MTSWIATTISVVAEVFNRNPLAPRAIEAFTFGTSRSDGVRIETGFAHKLCREVPESKEIMSRGAKPRSEREQPFVINNACRTNRLIRRQIRLGSTPD